MYALIVVLLLLFMWIDVWYYFHMALIYVACLIRRRLYPRTLFGEHGYNGKVLPHDLSDAENYKSMNYSRYLREFEYGKAAFWLESRVYDVIKRSGATVATQGSFFQLLQPLQFFDRYVVTTQLFDWDNNAMYFKQTIISKTGNITFGVGYFREVLDGVVPDDVIRELGYRDKEKPKTTKEMDTIFSLLKSSGKESSGLKRQ